MNLQNPKEVVNFNKFSNKALSGGRGFSHMNHKFFSFVGFLIYGDIAFSSAKVIFQYSKKFEMKVVLFKSGIHVDDPKNKIISGTT